MMRLSDLIKHIEYKKIIGPSDVMINGMNYDSREVSPGDLFFCLPGAALDGHEFALPAANSGAVVLVVERELAIDGLTQVLVTDSRKAMGVLSAVYYRYPSQELRVIGVTGTNGKTTTTHLIKAILEEAGFGVGLIGTIHILIGDKVLPVKNTTPASLDLQKLLRAMVDFGLEYVVMEVSSHALALGRVEGCEYDTAVFTNLTRDHLDFHQTFDNYASAKALLFEGLGTGSVKIGPKTAVINIDDIYGAYMVERSGAVVVSTFGVVNKADIYAENVQVTAKGTSFTIVTQQGEFELSLKLTGMFNVYNVLAAASAALAEGISNAIITQALEKLGSVSGRFEVVDEGQNFAVVVDYAHTPDGLENVLLTARELSKGRVLVVFGCGGDRDRTKRPIMGALAARYADYIIVTSDNPRSEDPLLIMEDIVRGITDSGLSSDKFKLMADRREAIRSALTQAYSEDIVLIAGKGHETYQILKDKTIPFDDREIAREILKELKG